MTFALRLWNKLTHNKALEESSGKLETLFFESVYRMIYVIGISTVEPSWGYFIYSSIVKLFITLIVISELWYFFKVTWNVDTIIDTVNITFIQFSCLFKYRNMVIHHHTLKNLASSMESSNFDITTEARRKLIDEWVMRNKSYLKFLLMMGSCTLVAWYSFPFMDDIDYNLMVAVHLPFDYKTPSVYPAAYVMVMVMFTYVSYFVIANDILLQTYLIHQLCQFTVLQDCFSNILNECLNDFNDVPERQIFGEERFRKKINNRLRDLTDQHRLILNNTLELRKVLSMPLLGHLATSSVLICSIGYQIVTFVSSNLTKSVMGFFYLGYNMIILYVFCHWCEEISIQSAGIGSNLYCSGWERGLSKIPRVRSCLLLIFIRANKPLVLSAGGMYDLSLEAYANLVKTSYSGLTMLLRFRHG